jgi:hypothetical protein
MGFVLESEEAQALITKDTRNRNVLFPFLNGEDLNTHPNQSASRWVINFWDWPSDATHDNSSSKLKGPPYATKYPECLSILEARVKQERAAKSAEVASAPWWQFWRIRSKLYATIAGLERVIVLTLHTKYAAFTFAPADQVFSHALALIATDETDELALLCSACYEVWAFNYGSSLGQTLRYTPSDCYETFPFPSYTLVLGGIGERYYTHRQEIMQSRQEGLTKTYNRFHNPEELAEDIERLRELHVEMDRAVADAYGWDDFDLCHDFHETKQGMRFTISEEARREVLDRLLLLNHERYAEEVEQGLHDKKKGKGKAKKQTKPKADGGTALFSELGDEA